jgi:flagellar motor component MotA
MDWRRALGGLGALGLLVVAILMGSPLGVFLDLPSALLVFGGGVLAWLAIVGDRWRALPDALRAERPTAAQLDAAEDVARSGRRAVWLMGLVSTIIGLIQIMQGLDDPSALGPALAVAVMTLFYAGLADVFVVSPLITKVRLRHSEAASAPGLDREHQQQLDAALDTLRKLQQQQSQRVD